MAGLQGTSVAHPWQRPYSIGSLPSAISPTRSPICPIATPIIPVPLIGSFTWTARGFWTSTSARQGHIMRCQFEDWTHRNIFLGAPRPGPKCPRQAGNQRLQTPRPPGAWTICPVTDPTWLFLQCKPQDMEAFDFVIGMDEENLLYVSLPNPSFSGLM